MSACAKGDLAVIDRLLISDSILRSVTATDPQGRTALQYILQTKPKKLGPANKAAFSRMLALLIRRTAEADVAAFDISSLRHFQTYMQEYPETFLLLISLGVQYRYCHETPACVRITSQGPRAQSQVSFRSKQCALFAREAAWFRRKAFAFVHYHCKRQRLLADKDKEASLAVSQGVAPVVLGKMDLANRIASFI